MSMPLLNSKPIMAKSKLGGDGDMSSDDRIRHGGDAVPRSTADSLKAAASTRTKRKALKEDIAHGFASLYEICEILNFIGRNQSRL
jgi:hypothetical protein